MSPTTEGASSRCRRCYGSPRLEPVREPSHRLTQHKRLGSRFLGVPLGSRVGTHLLMKGSKLEAVPAGWSLLSALVDESTHAPRAHFPGSIGVMEDARRIGCWDPMSARLVAGRRELDAEILDRRVARLAGRQHGVVARWQLARARADRADDQDPDRATAALQSSAPGRLRRGTSGDHGRERGGWRPCSPSGRTRSSAIARPGSSGDCVPRASHRAGSHAARAGKPATRPRRPPRRRCCGMRWCGCGGYR